MTIPDKELPTNDEIYKDQESGIIPIEKLKELIKEEDDPEEKIGNGSNGGLTYREIRDNFRKQGINITKQGVRKIERRALKKVAKILKQRYGITTDNFETLFVQGV